MSGFDQLVPGFKEKVELAESVIEARPKEQQEKMREVMRGDMTREQAVMYGQALGESEAERRRETGADKDQRVRRAMAYAAWEFDGRPQGMIEHLREFGVEVKLTASLDREASKRLLRKEKK